jgi:hypothetical protein
MILSCYVRRVKVWQLCWTILRSEIKVNSIHKIFRAIFVTIDHKFVEKFCLVVESIRACLG